MSIALIRLERNAKVRVLPREEAGIYLTLEGNPGALSQFQCHVFPHPLENRPDSLAPIQMSVENQLTTRRSSVAMVVHPKRAPSLKFNSAEDLKPLSQLERKAEFHSITHVETYLPL